MIYSVEFMETLRAYRGKRTGLVMIKILACEYVKHLNI